MPESARFMRCDLAFEGTELQGVLDRTWRRSAETGLTTKSTAPARIALTTVSMPPWAVWTITGRAVPPCGAAQHRHAVQLGHDQIENDERNKLALGRRRGAASASRPLAATAAR